jgi:ADP-ribose pyrophosphatase YjhB (NUDIX family)
MQSIRGKSIVIFEGQDRYLFTACYEGATGKKYCIPVGGGIESGEHSVEAAERVVLEETGLEIENLQLIDVSENIFTYNGVEEHEIVFAYKAEFKNKEAYTHLYKVVLTIKAIK